MKWRISPLGAAGLLIALGADIGLLGTIIAGLVSAGAVSTEKVDWNLTLEGSVGSVASRRPIEAYRAILEHPVFFKSRAPFVHAPKPPPQVSMVTPAPAVVDPGLVLGGVMIKRDVRKALVFSKAGVGGAWTNEGDEFMGWQIRSINETGARLEQRGRSIDLQLYPRE
jgi:hypothetical protein